MFKKQIGENYRKIFTNYASLTSPFQVFLFLHQNIYFAIWVPLVEKYEK